MDVTSLFSGGCQFSDFNSFHLSYNGSDQFYCSVISLCQILTAEEKVPVESVYIRSVQSSLNYNFGMILCLTRGGFIFSCFF